MPILSDDALRERHGLAPDTPIRRIQAQPEQDRFTLQTDTFHEIELPSSFQYVEWSQAVAAEGGTVELEGETHWVGEGAPVTVRLHDRRGRCLARYRGNVYTDRFRFAVEVPEGVEHALVATAKIADLGLETESAPLRVLPRVQLRNVRCEPMEAIDGTALSLSADVQCRLDLDGMPATVAIHRHLEMGLTEPVAELQSVVRGEQIALQWQAALGNRAEYPSARELQQAAQVHGMAETAPYAEPAFVFQIRLLGVEATSEPLQFRDSVELCVLDASTGVAYADEPVTLERADGVTEEHVLDAFGRLRLDALPPGPLYASFPELIELEAVDSAGLDHDNSASKSSMVSLLPHQAIDVEAQLGRTPTDVTLLTGSAYTIRISRPALDFSF